tara:strand:- start:565 stop:696 length:132 start_codon:yes stop_codon:yes gene_type:complete
MTTEEKIAAVEKRIQELNLLISHWKKTHETNQKSLPKDQTKPN